MNRTAHGYFLVFLLMALSGFQVCSQTRLEQKEDHWILMVDQKPLDIRGVTFGFENDVKNYGYHLKKLKSMGVNTIRTWATGVHTQTLLDSAEVYGMKVMMGIWMRHGKPGMEADDRFDYLRNENGKEEMYRNAVEAVARYKGHPAVLIWSIGNEVFLNIETDAEKEAYAKLLERICSEIKMMDPDHPVASVEAWTFGLDWWEQFVPSLDIYGINCYGPGANILQDELNKRKINKPYVITEFGVTGEWDSPEDRNGVTIEPSDSAKYQTLLIGVKEWIEPKSSCLGVYIFHYADGDQFQAPWLFTHYQGMTRPQYWAIREAYSGLKPINQPPVIEHFELPDTVVREGTWIPVRLVCSNLENEELNVSFVYNQRSGSRKRRDQLTPLEHRGNLEKGFEIRTPKEHGSVKIYVCVGDAFQNVGIATSSIRVMSITGAPRKYLVPRPKLPFYVYRDGIVNPYISSGHMGNFEAITVNLRSEEQVHEGDASLKISYLARDNWYGVGFVDPPGDWGKLPGGYDLTGAKTFSFWARADDNVKVKVGFGLIEADQPFPDTSKKYIEVKLSEEWKQFKINVKKMDLSCIRSGLVIFGSSQGFPHEIYIDDVVFE